MKRRTFVKAAAVSLPTFGILSAARAQSKEIRMIEIGRSQRRFDPGGLHRSVEGQDRHQRRARKPELARQARALVESGQGGTTLFELGSGIVLQAKKLGLIEKLDWAAINPAAMFPEAKNEYGFGYQYFSTIMAWRKGRRSQELHRVLRHQGVPRQAHPAGLTRTTACPSRCRRRACRSTSCSRSTSTSPSRS